jgi:hypothetical protein
MTILTSETGHSSQKVKESDSRVTVSTDVHMSPSTSGTGVLIPVHVVRVILDELARAEDLTWDVDVPYAHGRSIRRHLDVARFALEVTADPPPASTTERVGRALLRTLTRTGTATRSALYRSLSARDRWCFDAALADLEATGRVVVRTEGRRTTVNLPGGLL